MTVSAFAIIVAFYPDLARLGELCALLGHNAEVIVVDNTPDACSPPEVNNASWISMGKNTGIAAAQNVGIRAALARGANCIAFFDQDSIPEERLLPDLVAALGSPARGVVAPICIDARTGEEYPPFRFNRLGWAKPIPVIGKTENVAVDLIISSGSVVAAEVFNEAGLMDEDFFIDYVDLEWCIRCRNAGVPITIVNTVTMKHLIGSAVVKHGALTIFVHSPVRAYYRVRNAFLLLRKHHVPLLYSVHEILAAIVHHVMQVRHSQSRLQHLKLGWRGLCDGIRGSRGKLDSI